MKNRICRAAYLVVAIAITACASTTVTSHQSLVSEKLPRPNHIWVYDFAATASDVPSDAGLFGFMDTSATQTSEQVNEGRELGAQIATSLVSDIQAMGLPAMRGGYGTSPEINDIVIRGYLVSVQEGSTVKRMVVGFGAGNSELDTVVEGYQMTPQGLRKLGSGSLSSEGNKTPGLIVPAAVTIASGSPIGLVVMGGMKVYGEASGRNRVEGRADKTAQAIADRLKIRFQQEGWIS
jgi:hypothetical protein